MQGTPFTLRLSVIGAVDAVQYADKRGFARAILTDQTVDFAAANLQINLGQGDHAGKTLT